MAIEFACSSCGELVRVGEAAAGKKGKCPHCAAIVQIPLATPPQPLPSAPLQPAPAAAPGAPIAAKKPKSVAFLCHHCGKTVNAPPAMIGKRGKCPFCQTFLIIGSDAAPPAAPQQPPLVELTPIDDGLTPLGGLTPLSSAGLTPLGSGLTPLSSDPLAELSSLPSLGSAPLAPAPQYAAKPLAASNPLGVAPGLASYSTAGHGAASYASARPSAPAKLMVPAIAMMAIAVLSTLWLGWEALKVMLYPIVLPMRLELQLELHGDPQLRETYVMAMFVAQLAVSGIGALVNAGVIAGAVQMLRMTGLGTAKTGAALALIPCSCCCVNLPFGIWALIVLGQDDVRRRFRN